MFPNKYWESESNKRNFLEKLKVQFNITCLSDWGKLTTRNVHKAGGATLMKYYNNSLFKCLQSIYKGIFRTGCHQKEFEWKREWFPTLPRFPTRHRGHWNSLDNCRTFLTHLAKSYSIQSTRDWNRITLSLIQLRGGRVFHFLIVILRVYLPSTEIQLVKLF